MAKRKDIMLAYPMTQARFDKMPKPVVVQPKLNGNRCRAIFNEEGKVSLLSSSAAPIVSMPHIIKELESLPIKNIELDGELYHHGWSHQRINGIVRRTITMGEEHFQIGYYIFDGIDEKVVQVNRLPLLQQLTALIGAHKAPHVCVLETWFAANVKDVMFWLSKFMEKGYEGIIIRSPSAPYIRKRTANLLKLKPMKFDTFEIIGYKKELTKVCIHCRETPSRCTCVVVPDQCELVEIPLDTLGALQCKTLEGKEFYVGSGQVLTDSSRSLYWESRHALVGKKALVKYQNLSDGGVPIHGVLEEIE